MTSNQPLQFSLWSLFVTVSLVAAGISSIRAGTGLILMVGIWIVGFGAAGFVCYTAINAVYIRRVEPLGRLASFAWRSVLGSTFLFAVIQIGSWSYDSYTYDDRVSIDDRYMAISQALEEGDDVTAYGYMSSEYRITHSIKMFQEDFDEDTFPPLSPGRSLSLIGSRATLYPHSSRLFELWSGPIFHWICEQDEWYLTGEVDYPLD